MVAVPPPLRFNRTTDTLVFVHIAKCGGTSFNRRLMSLAVGGAPCVCNPPEASGTPPRTHNGHAVVQPSACACPRLPSGAKAPAQWSELAASRLGAQRQRQWRFLQAQWLVSPETTGWLGGVNAPVRVLHAYLMLAARLTSSHALASGIHFVTLLREPLSRFLSEFYETYDGWEVHHGTPPRLSQMSACSARLPEPLRTRARLGIDNTTKALYEELFPHWLACPANMASSRQTRALAYAALITQGRPASTANQQGSQRAGAGRTVPDADAALRRTVCAQLPRGAADRGCALHLARRALYQFTFVGLSSRRCAAEKLMEAQLGLRFGAPPVVVSDDSGNQDGGNRDGGRGGNGNGNGDGVDSNVRDGLRRSRRKAARKGGHARRRARHEGGRGSDYSPGSSSSPQEGSRGMAAEAERAPVSSSARPAEASVAADHTLGQGAHRVAKLSIDGLDQGTRKRLRELNADDLLLYAEAEALFRRRLAAYGIPHDVDCGGGGGGGKASRSRPS